MATQEQFDKALKRAHDEGLAIVGESLAPDGTRAWSVWNPQHGDPDAGWYTCRQRRGSSQVTCNCVAGSHGKPCKHAALCIEQGQPASYPEQRQTVGEMYTDRMDGSRYTDLATFSLWR